jgi:taurine dioxygenase
VASATAVGYSEARIEHEDAAMLTCRLTEIGGLEIEGVDLSSPLSADIEREIGRLYDEHGLLVFRDQHLTKQQLVDATGPFGGPDLDPPVNDTEPDVPGVTVISTRGSTGDIVPHEKEELVGEICWHTDQAYVTRPNRGKLLYAVTVPEVGGRTGFIDGALTYAALPDDLKDRIKGLHVIQSWAHAREIIHRNRGYRHNNETVLADDRFPDTAYRLVHEHPKTGRRVLNLPQQWACGIVELPGAEGKALMDQLFAHLLQPQFAYWHDYRPGDLVAWDNWRFLHAAGGTPRGYVRTMWSVVIRGGPSFGRVLDESGAAAIGR